MKLHGSQETIPIEFQSRINVNNDSYVDDDDDLFITLTLQI